MFDDLEDASVKESKMQDMLKNNMKREVMHLLFSQGANTSIEKIKKECDPTYQKSELFTQAVVELSSSTTNAQGSKLFRLDQKAGHEAMYEPFHIMKKSQQTHHQSAYEQFYKNNPKCNNIVGDYQGNYKYSTDINQSCMKAFSKSQLLCTLLASTLKECILMGSRYPQSQSDKEHEEKLYFKEDLFPRMTMNMTLKLLVIIGQN